MMPFPSRLSIPSGYQVKRWAVIHDPHYEHCPAIGVALEYEDRVDTYLPSIYAMPAYYCEPITIGGTIDIGPQIIEAGDSAYFDAVLVDLSRAFAIVPGSAPDPVNTRSPFGV